MESKEYTDKEIESIRVHLKTLDSLVDNPQYNDAGVVGMELIEIFKLLGRTNFLAIETVLREMKSRIHLLALPLEKAFGNKFSSFIPEEPESKIEHALWVCMNGANEAKDTLSKFAITETENKIQLCRCGFLTPANN